MTHPTHPPAPPASVKTPPKATTLPAKPPDAAAGAGQTPAPPEATTAAAITPLELAAQQVAEQYRERLRRTRGLDEYLSYIRSAFMAGMAYQVSNTVLNRPAYQNLSPGSTYQIDGTYGEAVLH